MISPSRLALILNPFHERPFVDAVGQARNVGIDFVEFPHGVWPEEEADLPRVLEQHELRCRVVNIPARLGRVTPQQDNREMEQLVSAAVRTASVAGANFVQLHTGMSGSTPADRVIYELGELLRPMVRVARDAGIALLLENNFDSRDEDPGGVNPIRHASSMNALADAIGEGGFGFCYDPANFVLTGTDPHPALRTMGPRVGNVHLKDCRPLQDVEGPPVADRSKPRDSLCGTMEWVELGAGSVPWKTIIATLDEQAYEGTLTLEPVWTRDLSPSAWTGVAAATARDWLSTAR